MTHLREPLVAALALALLLGCAKAPPAGRTVLAGNAAQTLLILPLNVSSVMPPELDSMSSFVRKELEIYLADHGKTLKTVAYPAARRLWLNSIREVRSGPDGQKTGYDDAARVFVRKLAQHADFDTVIAPSLYVQKAQISGRVARWDGVERELEIEEDGRKSPRIPANAPLEGEAPGASLHAVVLDSKGVKIQEARGGLELLVSVRVQRNRRIPNSEPKFAFATRTDLFANRAHLREGIAEALAPFLPPLPLREE